MSAPAGLQVDYRSLAGPPTAPWDSVLGVVTFRDPPDALRNTDIPLAQVATPVLDGDASVCEIWESTGPVESGRKGPVRYRRDERFLFGCAAVPETVTLHAATELAYREIYSTLDALGYGHLVRVWNYLPEINATAAGMERYWQFNKARRAALVACGRDVTGNVPAACALGASIGSPLVVYFLASRSAPVAVENPRQVSAYNYPPQYGPRPVFARASLLPESKLQPGSMLFISGTASIVGHETRHVGDPGAQTRETLVNIEALLDEANRLGGGARFALGDLAYKVYVRHSSDLPEISAEVGMVIGSAKVVYLRADICRQDLLVEIEAAGRPA